MGNNSGIEEVAVSVRFIIGPVSILSQACMDLVLGIQNVRKNIGMWVSFSSTSKLGFQIAWERTMQASAPQKLPGRKTPHLLKRLWVLHSRPGIFSGQLGGVFDGENDFRGPEMGDEVAKIRQDHFVVIGVHQFSARIGGVTGVDEFIL